MMEMKRILAVSIILLFIGVAVAPSINQSAVTASQEDDLIEVTSQACGIKGYKDTTVKLTREQYQDLEQYLVKFRARLNQTTTREEAVPLFKDAVVELDKYELLPRGMSVEQIQRLVTGEFLNKNILKLQTKSNSNHFFERGRLYNRFSLIAGGATNCFFVGPFVKSGGFFDYLWFTISLILHSIIPVIPFGKICLYGSFGQIYTFGAFGYNTIDANFMYGDINIFRFVTITTGGHEDLYYCGVRGFSGLQFYSRTSSLRYFFGWCLEVNIVQVPPFDI